MTTTTTSAEYNRRFGSQRKPRGNRGQKAYATATQGESDERMAAYVALRWQQRRASALHSRYSHVLACYLDELSAANVDDVLPGRGRDVQRMAGIMAGLVAQLERVKGET